MQNYIMLGDSTSAWHNLAMEELLFDALGSGARVLYLWQNRDTVVIGRHQNAWKECRVRLLEDEGGYLARRMTGGGAVFHDLGNLNFSFVAPQPEYDVHRQLDVVRAAVASFGIRAEFTGRNDLVLADGGEKFSGNAFRYSRGVGLHHGTIMVNVALDRLGRYLAPDPGKLRAKGIDSVRSRVRNLSELSPSIAIEPLKEALCAAFVEAFGPAQALSDSDLDAVRLGELERRYDSWDFRLGRAMPFDATLERRFAWGGVTLELNLREGVITGARVYSDAMDEAMIARVGPAMLGARYQNESLSQALRALEHPQANELAEWLQTTDLGGHST